MANRPTGVDEAIQFVWNQPDTVLQSSEKQSLCAILAKETDVVAKRYFLAPLPEQWVGTLKELLAPRDTTGQHLGTEQVRRLLVIKYTSGFQLRSFQTRGSQFSEKRATDLPLPDSSGKISAFGSFFGLEGFNPVVQQVYRRLLRLHIGFQDSAQFTRSLQLLRLVAAPGLGKSTAFREIWAKLYQLACEAGENADNGTSISSLNRRILSSMKPDGAMVFLLDLSSTELQGLHPLEEELGARVSSVLALRMLYSSACDSQSTYSSFLRGMDPRLRRSIEPLDVLYFWRQAGGIEEGTLWMAVFAVDEVGAAIPTPTLQKPSWLQFALSHFVQLRKTAAELEGQNELFCMPVIITASTRASASSLHGTASGQSRVKDVHLRPLTDLQMEGVIVSLAKRSHPCVAIPSPLPPQLLLLLQLVGGNPRMLCQTLCLLAGSAVLHNEEFPAGRAQCWNWLQGDFNLVQVVDGLCNATLKDKWDGWLGADPVKVNMLNQLVAHCVCRVRIARQQLVPGSQAAGVPVKWQDMENDGLAYIGEPGEGLESGDSGDSSNSNASHRQASSSAAPEPGFELGSEGMINPDAEMHLVSLPPVLLVAAYRFMAPVLNRMVWVPLLNQLTDEWRQRELTDISVLVAKLLFWHDILHQPVVSLSALLGGIEVGEHEMSLYVPEGHFSVCEISSHVHEEITGSAQLQKMVSNMDVQWAFRGPGNLGPDSWLLLQQCHDDGSRSESSRIVLLNIQSKKRKAEACMQSGKLEEEVGKMLNIPGVDSLIVYVTDQRRPTRAKNVAQFVVPDSMVLVDRSSLPAYYSACVALLKTAVVSPHRTKRARDML